MVAIATWGDGKFAGLLRARVKAVESQGAEASWMDVREPRWRYYIAGGPGEKGPSI